MLVSATNEFIALDMILPCYLAVLGTAAKAEAKEKPDPSKSKNITLANWVTLLALSVKVLSSVSSLGPIPATLMYWAERPGVPTAMTRGLLLRLSATVSPSMP